MPHTPRTVAVAAVALAGLLFAWTPPAERADLHLFDAQSRFLRDFQPRAAPDDIIIVGVDDASVRAVPEPPGLWHEPLGRVIGKIAGAAPKAIGLDLALPDRSQEQVRPGIDRLLAAGLAAARRNGALVGSLQVDSRTRAAKAIHAPYLAILGDEGLGLGLHGRDVDGQVRRFSLAVPTEDGSFPTLVGRLCRALSKDCRDGLIDFALGKPFKYVPFSEVLASQDRLYMERLFKGRIVLLGETQRFADRVEVPVNLAGWETDRGSTPSVVVHAAALRTALHGQPPREASAPAIFVLVTLASLLVMMRDWRMAAVAGLVAGASTLIAATAALHHGFQVPVAPVLFVLVLSVSFRAVGTFLGRYKLVRK